MVRERPVFYPDFGGDLRLLREQRKWTQRQAAVLAQQKGHTALTRQVLMRLENGQVKNPEPEVLRAVAGLYNLPYEPLAARFAAVRYGIEITGSELVWHPAASGAADRGDPEQARLLAEHLLALADRANDLKSSIQDVAHRLAGDLAPHPK